MTIATQYDLLTRAKILTQEAGDILIETNKALRAKKISLAQAKERFVFAAFINRRGEKYIKMVDDAVEF